MALLAETVRLPYTRTAPEEGTAHALELGELLSGDTHNIVVLHELNGRIGVSSSPNSSSSGEVTNDGTDSPNSLRKLVIVARTEFVLGSASSAKFVHAEVLAMRDEGLQACGIASELPVAL